MKSKIRKEANLKNIYINGEFVILTGIAFNNIN